MDKKNNIEGLFEQAKSEPTGLSFNETRLNFEKTIGSASYTPSAKVAGAKIKLFKIIIMSVSLVSIVVLSIYLFSGTNETNSFPDLENISEIKLDSISKVEENNDKITSAENLPKQIENSNIDITSLPLREIAIQKNIVELKNRLTPTSFSKIERVENRQDYFPKLTAEEIAENNKRIKKMRKDFLKKKKNWSYLPAGSFKINGESKSVQAFYVKTTEVTNLEYKTFLFDLLRKGEKEAFNKAKPNQKQWSITFGEFAEPMEEMYFSHPAYNDYPVCNVSAKGAQMFCKWFTTVVEEETGKSPVMFRLPVEEEWRYVASERGKLQNYACGDEVRNEKGCYFTNFHAGTESDTTKNEYKADGGFFTVKANSYLANDYGVYNITGNVSEMILVKEENLTDVKQIGGSFISDHSELKVSTEAKPILFPAGSPDVGFRPVITFLSQGARDFGENK